MSAVDLSIPAPQPASEWAFVVVLVLGMLAVIAALAIKGRSDKSGIRGLVLRICDALERSTGLTAWSTGTELLAVWALLVAFLGFIWDVAWHIDLGRDTVLLTVPHTMILVGLLSLGLAALVSILLATVTEAPVGFRLGRLRIPFSAIPLGLLSAGAALAFPLDDLWHRTYGIDVTMWSPTHLLMIGGASLAPIAVALVVAEGGGWRAGTRHRRFRGITAMGAILVGLSTFQLEFDFGIPQWQALYHPVLVMLAGGIALVAARAAFGRWAAVGAVLAFLVIRGGIALVVGPLLGRTTPHLPLYIVAALAVEIAFVVAARWRTLARGLLAGVLVGTVGLAAEWAWSQVWSPQPWTSGLIPGVWAAVAAATVGGVIGMAVGSTLSGRASGISRTVLVAVLLATVALLAMPFPRNTIPVSVQLTTTQVGPAALALDRDGATNLRRNLAVDLTVAPPDAMRGADFFRIAAWQGGSLQNIALLEGTPGHFHSASPVPTGGTWKSMVELWRGDIVMAAPIALPGDAASGAAAVTPGPDATIAMVPASKILTSETHNGSPWPARLAYGMFGLTLVVWMTALCLAFSSVHRRRDQSGSPPGITAVPQNDPLISVPVPTPVGDASSSHR